MTADRPCEQARDGANDIVLGARRTRRPQFVADLEDVLSLHKREWKRAALEFASVRTLADLLEHAHDTEPVALTDFGPFPVLTD